MGRRLGIPALLLLALGLGACGQSSQATSERRQNGGGPLARTTGRPAVRVTTAVAEARPIQRSVETVGSVLAWEEVVAKSQGPS